RPPAPAVPSLFGLLNTLSFGGGIDGIGVTSSTPRVYLVFYGSQWTGGGDPDGAATYLQHLFAGIGTGGELWSGTMTQYCDGPTVSPGATSCPSGAPHVGYPASGALAGVWFDTAGPSPSNASAAQLAAEAARAAAHFGNTTPASNRYAQYVVVSPSGTHPDGFNTITSNFCAWHDYTGSSYGDLAFTNMPYVTDLGQSCGQNFVNSGSAGGNCMAMSSPASSVSSRARRSRSARTSSTRPCTRWKRGVCCARAAERSVAAVASTTPSPAQGAADCAI